MHGRVTIEVQRCQGRPVTGTHTGPIDLGDVQILLVTLQLASMGSLVRSEQWRKFSLVTGDCKMCARRRRHAMPRSNREEATSALR